MIQSIRPTRSHLARFARILLVLLARVLRFVLTKIFEKKSVSQLSRNALKRIEMQKENYPFDPIRETRSSKPERNEILIQSMRPKFQYFDQVS